MSEIIRKKADSNLYAIVAGIFSIFIILLRLFTINNLSIEEIKNTNNLGFLEIYYLIYYAAFAIVLFISKKNWSFVVFAVLNTLETLFLTNYRSMAKLNFLSLAYKFVSFAILILFLIYAVLAVLNEKKHTFEKALEVLCIIIIVMKSVQTLYNFINIIVLMSKYAGSFVSIISFVSPLLYAFCFIFTTLWLSPYNTKEEEIFEEEKMLGYVRLYKHILYLFFTYGIWELVWIYRTTKALNQYYKDESKHRDPVAKLLLCMFIPFYYWYWTYKTAKMIDELLTERGIESNIALLSLILAIFLKFVSPIVVQNSLNILSTDVACDIRNNTKEENENINFDLGDNQKTINI